MSSILLIRNKQQGGDVDDSKKLLSDLHCFGYDMYSVLRKTKEQLVAPLDPS